MQPLAQGNPDSRLRAAEEKYRAVLSVLEQVLSLGDFQKQVDTTVDPVHFIHLTGERIDEIIQPELKAIYTVDQATSDISTTWFAPVASQKEIETQVESLIQGGYIAWALRERREILVYSVDRRYRVLLHAIATYSRIRGIFIGFFPAEKDKLSDGSLQALSLLLRNAANAMESMEYIAMFQHQNAQLQTKVDEKVGELRRRDQQLLNAQKMDAIATLAGGVAHQYNNALSILMGNIELIKLGIVGGKEPGKYIERIEGVAYRMQELTAKLLAYARGGKYLPQKIPIKALVESVLVDVTKDMPDHIQIKVAVPAEACSVRVDVIQMQMVLSAIVTNATEALPSGGHIHIHGEIVPIQQLPQDTKLELVPGEYIVLQISDNGQGMDERALQHIFEPFFTTKFEGRGLSMAAAYGIVKNHSGAICVESAVGRGTTVHVYLPLASSSIENG
jgi:signal transduction histidine kinase